MGRSQLLSVPTGRFGSQTQATIRSGDDHLSYTGTITINAGAFKRVRGIKLEHSDSYTQDGNTLTFDFHDGGYVYGLSFTTPAAATTITYNLNIDNIAAPASEIYLGTNRTNPSQNPFTIPRS